MAASASNPEFRSELLGQRWKRHRLTVVQFEKMAEFDMLLDASYELREGTLYRSVKGELHGVVVHMVADAVRGITSPGYYVRQEFSCRDGEYSILAPDVAVARGARGDCLPLPPPLERMALIVEVSLSTETYDGGKKLRRYAAAGVPGYWIVRVTSGLVSVYQTPQGGGKLAGYASRTDYKRGEDFSAVIDGTQVGRVAVADLFPMEPRADEANL